MKKSKTKIAAKQSGLRSPSMILAVIFGLVGIILGLIVTLYIQRPTSTLTELPRAGNDSLTIEIERVQRIPAMTLRGEEISDSAQGLIISLAVKNHTDEPQQFIPVSQMYVRFANSDMLAMTPVLGVKNPITAGPVNPDEVLRGDVSFLIDNTHYDGRLFFDGRWADSAPLIISIAQ